MKSACFDRHRTVKKAISILTLLVFIFNFVLTDAWAVVTDPSTGSYSHEAGKFSQLDVGTFTIPQDLGIVKYSGKGDPNKVIVHIQDAHCNYAAQKKISKIIEYLNEEYGIEIVNLEGGTGDYDLSIFTGIYDKGTREDVADYFVKWGLVNGAELFALNSPDKVTLWGVEDTGLYLKNLGVYRDSLSYKDEVDRYLKQLDHVLNNLKIHIFPEELLELDKKYGQYRAENIEFKDYMLYLLAKAKQKGINIRNFPNIYLLSQSLEQEGKIDFKKASNERDALVDRLEEVLSRNELKELVSKTVEFRNKQISQNDFYDYLIKKAKQTSQDLEDFPELHKYIIYISLYNAVDKTRIVQEMENLEKEIKDTIYTSDKQRELDLLSKNLILTRDIFDISFTRDDYRYYKKNRSAFDVHNYLSFIKKEAPIYKISTQLDKNITKLDGYREKILNFYEYSFKRDGYFLKNIKFGGDKIRSGIFVTGGFHTENLLDLFKKNNISYVSIVPNFRDEEGYKCPYFDVLSGGMSPLERSIEAALSSIQVASLCNALGAEASDPKRAELFRMGVLALGSVREAGEPQAIGLDDGKFIVFAIENGDPVCRIQDTLGKAQLVTEEKFGKNAANLLAALSEIAQDRIIRHAERKYLDAESDIVRQAMDSLPEGSALKAALGDLLAKKSYVDETGRTRAPPGYTGVQIVEGLLGGHAAQAIYLPKDATAATLIHELVAGMYAGTDRLDSHGLAEAVEGAFRDGNLAAMEDLLASARLHAVEGENKAVWDMTADQRRRLEARDYAAVLEARGEAPAAASLREVGVAAEVAVIETKPVVDDLALMDFIEKTFGRQGEAAAGYLRRWTVNTVERGFSVDTANNAISLTESARIAAKVAPQIIPVLIFNQAIRDGTLPRELKTGFMGRLLGRNAVTRLLRGSNVTAAEIEKAVREADGTEEGNKRLRDILVRTGRVWFAFADGMAGRAREKAFGSNIMNVLSPEARRTALDFAEREGIFAYGFGRDEHVFIFPQDYTAERVEDFFLRMQAELQKGSRYVVYDMTELSATEGKDGEQIRRDKEKEIEIISTAGKEAATRGTEVIIDARTGFVRMAVDKSVAEQLDRNKEWAALKRSMPPFLMAAGAVRATSDSAGFITGNEALIAAETAAGQKWREDEIRSMSDEERTEIWERLSPEEQDAVTVMARDNIPRQEAESLRKSGRDMESHQKILYGLPGINKRMVYVDGEVIFAKEPTVVSDTSMLKSIRGVNWDASRLAMRERMGNVIKPRFEEARARAEAEAARAETEAESARAKAIASGTLRDKAKADEAEVRAERARRRAAKEYRMIDAYTSYNADDLEDLLAEVLRIPQEERAKLPPEERILMVRGPPVDFFIVLINSDGTVSVLNVDMMCHADVSELSPETRLKVRNELEALLATAGRRTDYLITREGRAVRMFPFKALNSYLESHELADNYILATSVALFNAFIDKFEDREFGGENNINKEGIIEAVRIAAQEANNSIDTNKFREATGGKERVNIALETHLIPAEGIVPEEEAGRQAERTLHKLDAMRSVREAEIIQEDGEVYSTNAGELATRVRVFSDEGWMKYRYEDEFNKRERADAERGYKEILKKNEWAEINLDRARNRARAEIPRAERLPQVEKAPLNIRRFMVPAAGALLAVPLVFLSTGIWAVIGVVGGYVFVNGITLMVGRYRAAKAIEQIFRKYGFGDVRVPYTIRYDAMEEILKSPSERYKARVLARKKNRVVNSLVRTGVLMRTEAVPFVVSVLENARSLDEIGAQLDHIANIVDAIRRIGIRDRSVRNEYLEKILNVADFRLFDAIKYRRDVVDERVRRLRAFSDIFTVLQPSAANAEEIREILAVLLEGANEAKSRRLINALGGAEKSHIQFLSTAVPLTQRFVILNNMIKYYGRHGEEMDKKIAARELWPVDKYLSNANFVYGKYGAEGLAPRLAVQSAGNKEEIFEALFGAGSEQLNREYVRRLLRSESVDLEKLRQRVITLDLLGIDIYGGEGVSLLDRRMETLEGRADRIDELNKQYGLLGVHRLKMNITNLGMSDSNLVDKAERSRETMIAAGIGKEAVIAAKREEAEISIPEKEIVIEKAVVTGATAIAPVLKSYKSERGIPAETIDSLEKARDIVMRELDAAAELQVGDRTRRELITYHNELHFNELFEFFDAVSPKLQFQDRGSAERLARLAIYLHDIGYFREDPTKPNVLAAGHEDRSIARVKELREDLGLEGLELDAVVYMVEKTKMKMGDEFAQEIKDDNRAYKQLEKARSGIQLDEAESSDLQEYLSKNFPNADMRNEDHRKMVMDTIMGGKAVATADTYGHAETYPYLVALLQPEFVYDGSPVAKSTRLEQIAATPYFMDKVALDMRLKYILGIDSGGNVVEGFEDRALTLEDKIPIELKNARRENIKTMSTVARMINSVKAGEGDVGGNAAALRAFVESGQKKALFNAEITSEMRSEIDNFVFSSFIKAGLIGKVYGRDGQLLTDGFRSEEKEGKLIVSHAELDVPIAINLVARRDIDKDQMLESLDAFLSDERPTTLTAEERGRISELRNLLGNMVGLSDRVAALEDNESILGHFGSNGVLYLNRKFITNPLALIHELGEGIIDVPEGYAITRHTYMRGVGEDVRDTYDALVADGADMDRMTAEEFTSALEDKMRDMGLRPMTESERGLIFYNFEQVDRKGAGKKALLFGLQDHLDPAGNLALTRDIGSLVDGLRRGCLNIVLIPSLNVETMAGQEKYARKISRSFRKLGINTRVSHFDTDLEGELKKAIDEATAERNKERLPKIFVYCLTEQDKIAAERAQKEYPNLIVIGNDISEEVGADEVQVDEVRVVAVASAILNDKRLREDFGLTPQDLIESRMSFLTAFNASGILDANLEGITAEGLEDIMQRLYTGDIALRITRVNWEEIRDWENAQEEILRSL